LRAVELCRGRWDEKKEKTRKGAVNYDSKKGS